MNSGCIYLIGGANYQIKDSLKTDLDIIKESGQAKPKVLYIGAANKDKIKNKNVFKDYYESLNASVNFLDLYLATPTLEEVSLAFKESDIIYFAGGMTARLLAVSQKYNLSALILHSYAQGKIIAGVSAGAILLCSGGYVDNLAYNYGLETLNYGFKEALNIINGIFCPHYEIRGKITFNDFIKTTKLDGYALDDGVSLKIKDGYFTVIKSPSMGAYRFLQQNDYLLEALKENFKYEIKLNL